MLIVDYKNSDIKLVTFMKNLDFGQLWPPGTVKDIALFEKKFRFL